MDLKVLHYCEVVRRLGSFTRAAEEIHIAQPALSIAIAKLEQELGVVLFSRLPRGVIPTPECDILIARASRVFEEIDSARREIQDATELRTGSIRIGFPPMYGLHYFPKLITQFRGKYPGIEVSAEEGSATEVRDKISSGAIDLGILESRRVDKTWRTVRTGSDEMVIAVNSNHPLAHQRTIKAGQISNLPMVVLSAEFLQRQLLDAYCARHRVRYRRVMECNFVQLTIRTALAGQGAATLLRSLVKEERGLVALSFEPAMPFNFDLCWRKDRYLSRASQALVQLATSA